MMTKLISLSLTCLLLITTACTASDNEQVTFGQVKVAMGDVKLDVEFAQSPEQRARGLMFRKQMCGDCGMLFEFEFDHRVSMWMKNTYSPLDVAFIDRNGVITDIKALQPQDLTPVGSSKPVILALEMNQGWFAKNGIAVGDQLLVNP